MHTVAASFSPRKLFHIVKPKSRTIKDLRKFLLDIHQFRSITTVSGLPIQNLNILLYDFVLVALLMVVSDRHVAMIKKIYGCVRRERRLLFLYSIGNFDRVLS